MSQNERKAIKGYVPIKPQERTKAAVLAGLVVVVVLFVVHGMTGSVSPKKVAQSNGVPGPPAPKSVASELHPAVGTDPFPVDKAGELVKKSTALAMRDVQDPFVQISGDGKQAESVAQSKAPAATKSKPRRDDSVSIAPAFVMEPVNKGQKGGLPSFETNASAPNPANVPAVIEPEIKLVGIINGDNPVATVDVNGNTVIAYPGDRLAKGYNLTSISADGIVIKHDSQTFSLRTGAVLNKK